MIHFECDYNEGCHPHILKRLNETNMMQTVGYGEDEICASAKAKIKKACLDETCEVHFLVGGTQANLTVIAGALRPYQGVISAVSGHINVHETGAIENTGHKVIALESNDGKLQAKQIQKCIQDHYEDSTHEHMVQPGMVYISYPSEYGTTYSLKELQEIYDVCQKNHLPLFIDGARMGYGLVNENCDVTLADFAKYSDVFYIGGTKVGALFGEAVVITNDSLKKDFRYLIKQHGGMLAKGRLLGIQFDELFNNNLYYEIAQKAVKQAMRIRKAFEEKNIKIKYDSLTNQQFPILNQKQILALKEKYSFSIIEKLNEEETVVRFCTSWATLDKDVDELIQDIQRL